MSAQIIALPTRQAGAVAFRTPGSPPPRDPPVWLPAVAPVKRPKPVVIPSDRQLFLQAAEVLHRWARDLGVTITVHPQGGAS